MQQQQRQLSAVAPGEEALPYENSVYRPENGLCVTTRGAGARLMARAGASSELQLVRV